MVEILNNTLEVFMIDFFQKKAVKIICVILFALSCIGLFVLGVTQGQVSTLIVAVVAVVNIVMGLFVVSNRYISSLAVSNKTNVFKMICAIIFVLATVGLVIGGVTQGQLEGLSAAVGALVTAVLAIFIIGSSHFKISKI